MIKNREPSGYTVSEPEPITPDNFLKRLQYGTIKGMHVFLVGLGDRFILQGQKKSSFVRTS